VSAARLALYLIDDHGARWRVYDVAFGPPLAKPHKRTIIAPSDTRARYRLFVPPDPAPMLRVHDFGKNGAGDRSLTVDVLAAQLATAQVSPKRRPAATREPPGTKLGQ
jgi:hypothetical protein